MKNKLFFLLVTTICCIVMQAQAQAASKLRVVLSTDLPPIGACMSGCAADHTSDPDDLQSIVRFLLYTNEFDVEGLVVSSATFANVAKKQNMLDVLDLYDQVDENLRQHDVRYPTADALKAVTFQGRSGTWGNSTANNIGTGKDSEASNAIISIIDKPDTRPVWFCFWGDCSNLAQAIWKVQNTRSAAELKTFLSKIRIYQIAHQDETIDWLMNSFPDLFIIYAQNTWQGMFGGPNDQLGNVSWINTNVRQNHGPLGAIYPTAAISIDGMKEGDSPSFLYMVSAAHGLNDPENPTQESWGGQFKRSGTTNHWIDATGTSSVSKWKSQFQTEFALRADWMLPSSTTPTISNQLKPRVIVLTDASPWETDDTESLIRLMAHADLFEIESLIFTTGWSWDNISTSNAGIDIINNVITAYSKDLTNLMKRSSQSGFAQDNTRQTVGYWPSSTYLSAKVMKGSLYRGMKFIGVSNNSPGSNEIIKIVDETDDRPVWISVWGSANTLAQAIWQVKQTRTADQLKTFLHKLRVYAITDQDRHYDGSEGYEVSSHQWLRTEFVNDLFFMWDDCAWNYQYNTGKNNWSQYETNIQGHGNLGTMYPKYMLGVEGDTPAFLHLMNSGLNDPNVPTQVGWGGYFQWGMGPDNKTYAYVNQTGTANTACKKYEDMFYATTFNNFAARMDWAKNGAGNRNPNVTIDGDANLTILTKTPQAGTTLVVDASQTSDPDGNSLTYKWWVQPEAGTYSGTITINNNTTNKASVQIPSNASGKTFHVICEVTDNGTPNLTSYRRIIFQPNTTGGASPVVSITSPTSSAVYTSPATISLTATATDADGTISKVEFYNGTTLLGSSTTSPYSYNWTNVATGSYSITAVATDNAGNKTTSTAVPISVIDQKIIKVPLLVGWNFIGYPLNGSSDLSVALSSIWSNVLTVKSADAFYNSSMPSALNSLTKLEWGKGYMIKVNSACEIRWSK